MRELSLHILDLIENSIRAGVTIVSLLVEEDHAQDLLKICVEDNGCGLQASPDVAVHPFYTTKNGKRVGLGLSLFQAAAQRAGGGLTFGKSALGGLAVTVTMRLNHVDRAPMGNLAGTLSSVACTNPGIDLRCRLRVNGLEYAVSVFEVAKELNFGEPRGLAVARRVSEKIKDAIVSLKASP